MRVPGKDQIVYVKRRRWYQWSIATTLDNVFHQKRISLLVVVVSRFVIAHEFYVLHLDGTEAKEPNPFRTSCWQGLR